jgi:hypothetical protein
MQACREQNCTCLYALHASALQLHVSVERYDSYSKIKTRSSPLLVPSCNLAQMVAWSIKSTRDGSVSSVSGTARAGNCFQSSSTYAEYQAYEYLHCLQYLQRISQYIDNAIWVIYQISQINSEVSSVYPCINCKFEVGIERLEIGTIVHESLEQAICGDLKTGKPAQYVRQLSIKGRCHRTGFQ